MLGCRRGVSTICMYRNILGSQLIMGTRMKKYREDEQPAGDDRSTPLTIRVVRSPAEVKQILAVDSRAFLLARSAQSSPSAQGFPLHVIGAVDGDLPSALPPSSPRRAPFVSRPNCGWIRVRGSVWPQSRRPCSWRSSQPSEQPDVRDSLSSWASQCSFGKRWKTPAMS